MTLPFPPWLTTQPKAAGSFFAFAQAGVARGLSANSIIESYTLAGPGIRRKLGLDVIRRVKDVEKKASALKYTPHKFRPDPSTIPVAMTKLVRDYSYKVKYEGVTAAGKTFEAFVTVAVDTNITVQQALNTAFDFLKNTPEEYGIESITKLTFEGVKKHARLA